MLSISEVFFQSFNDFSFVPAHLNFLLFFHESPVINLNLCGIDNPQLEFQHMQVCITSSFIFLPSSVLTHRAALHHYLDDWVLFTLLFSWRTISDKFIFRVFFFPILFYQFAFSLIPLSNIFYHSSLKHLRDFFFLDFIFMLVTFYSRTHHKRAQNPAYCQSLWNSLDLTVHYICL